MTNINSTLDTFGSEKGICGALRPPRRREQRRQTRERVILQAAQELMEEHGYDAMTMDDLAARAGITKPTLYQHFPSKEEIAVRAIVYRMRCAREFIAEQDPALPAIERLESFLRQMVEAKFRPGHLPIGPATRMALTPLLRANLDFQVEFELVVTAISDVIEQAKIERTFRRDLPTRVAVQMMFSVLRDGDYESMVKSESISFTGLTDAIVTTLLNGMRTTE